MDFVAFMRRQVAFSKEAFGEGKRSEGILRHIEKEIAEVRENPSDVTEWIDIAILALDGAWRAGHSPQQVADALHAKQATNIQRDWSPIVSEDAPIEHVRYVETGKMGESKSEKIIKHVQDIRHELGKLTACTPEEIGQFSRMRTALSEIIALCQETPPFELDDGSVVGCASCVNQRGGMMSVKTGVRAGNRIGTAIEITRQIVCA